MTAAKIADNPEAARFEVRIDGRLAGFAQYQLRGGTIVFPPTEIQPEFEGKGLGSVLARAALDGARDTGLTVVPECLFIRGYIESHPEYTELLESR